MFLIESEFNKDMSVKLESSCDWLFVFVQIAEHHVHK